MRDAVKYVSSQLSGVDGVVAVEVGAGYGVHASEFIDAFKFSSLTLVEIHSGGFEDMRKLSERFKFIKIVIGSSESAVKDFANESIDFIYIDADHSYDAVKKDIEMWFPKVKRGGYMAFHDYSEDVKRAVDGFFIPNGVEIVGFLGQPQAEASIKKI